MGRIKVGELKAELVRMGLRVKGRRGEKELQKMLISAKYLSTVLHRRNIRRKGKAKKQGKGRRCSRLGHAAAAALQPVRMMRMV